VFPEFAHPTVIVGQVLANYSRPSRSLRTNSQGQETPWIFAVLYVIYGLAVLLPSLAAAIRRLHDTGKSGWMILFGLIPFVGFIILIVFYVQPSDGSNAYGSGPED
jgi:uncharacterized membrane protein YhaH (DUF805 family)